MTVLLPEFLQTQKYSAQRLRQATRSAGIIQEGIVYFGDFKVSQRAAGANMSVDIAAGDAWVQGDDAARQGVYHVGNDGTVNLAVSAAHATKPRIDQVILRIYDSTVIGGPTDNAVLEVIPGTAEAGATLANRTGAAALPASSLRLADVLVEAADTTISTAQIGNPKDHRIGQSGYPAGALSSVEGAPPPYAYGHPADYVPAVEAVRATDFEHAVETLTAYPFDAADTYDLGNMHDIVTNNTKLFVKTCGFYSVGAQATQLAATTSGFRIIIASNGNILANSGVGASAGGALDMGPSAAIPSVRLAYGDYIEVLARHGSAGAKLSRAKAQLIWQAP